METDDQYMALCPTCSGHGYTTEIKTVADLIRLTAARKNRTLAESADDMGIGQTTMGRLVNGDGKPSIDTFRKLAEWSGYPTDALLFLTNQPEGDSK